MSNFGLPLSALTSNFSTSSAPDSSLNNAMSPVLPRTLVAILQVPFAFALSHEHVHCLRTLQRATYSLVMLGRDGFEHNPVILFVHQRPCTVLDVEQLAQPLRDDYLAFDRKINHIGFVSGLHKYVSY